MVDNKPMDKSDDAKSLLQIFAVRASAELERQRAQAKADHTQRILAERERLASIGEFASMISHEIRSPLSTIGMALEYVQGDNPSDKAMKRIKLAITEKDRLQSLLNEILLFAKPHLLNREPIDLDALIRETISTLEQGPESEHRQIDYRSEDRPVSVSGDRDKLMQVLINLVSNACQAVSKDDRVTIVLSDIPQRGKISIEVRNPGNIPSENLEKLTQPFFTTKSQGTGLGLAIAKRIVDAHDGQLQIQSDAQHGVCASIRLPMYEGKRVKEQER